MAIWHLTIPHMRTSCMYPPCVCTNGKFCMPIDPSVSQSTWNCEKTWNLIYLTPMQSFMAIWHLTTQWWSTPVHLCTICTNAQMHHACAQMGLFACPPTKMFSNWYETLLGHETNFNQHSWKVSWQSITWLVHDGPHMQISCTCGPCMCTNGEFCMPIDLDVSWSTQNFATTWKLI